MVDATNLMKVIVVKAKLSASSVARQAIMLESAPMLHKEVVEDSKEEGQTRGRQCRLKCMLLHLAKLMIRPRIPTMQGSSQV